MPNSKNWKPGGPKRILLFGRYKAGKTFGALSFPRCNVLDFDRGIDVHRHPEFIKKYGLVEFEYEQFIERTKGKGGVVISHNAFDDACR